MKSKSCWLNNIELKQQKIVGKLAKKMGADKMLDAFREGEEAQLKAIQDKARTFFQEEGKQDEIKKTLTHTF